MENHETPGVSLKLIGFWGWTAFGPSCTSQRFLEGDVTCKVIIDLPYGLPLRRLNGTLGLLNPPHHVSRISLLHCHLYFFLEWPERSLWACSTIEVGRASVWGEFSQWISESHETSFRSPAIYQRQKDKSALMSWWPSQWLKTESGFTPKRCRCCSPRMPIVKVQCIFTRPEMTSPVYSTAIGWWRETYNAFIQLCEWFLGWPTDMQEESCKNMQMTATCAWGKLSIENDQVLALLKL